MGRERGSQSRGWKRKCWVHSSCQEEINYETVYELVNILQIVQSRNVVHPQFDFLWIGGVPVVERGPTFSWKFCPIGRLLHLPPTSQVLEKTKSIIFSLQISFYSERVQSYPVHFKSDEGRVFVAHGRFPSPLHS